MARKNNFAVQVHRKLKDMEVALREIVNESVNVYVEEVAKQVLISLQLIVAEKCDKEQLVLRSASKLSLLHAVCNFTVTEPMRVLN